MEYTYEIKDSKELITPALIYYRDIIEENIAKAVMLAKSPYHLWPHVKTHKMKEMIELQMKAGISRFKCATIAEAEMAAMCGAAHVLLAYPLVGVNIRRFLALSNAFPSVTFWAIGDDKEQLRQLGKVFYDVGKEVNVLVDVNMGMNRTGISLDEVKGFFIDCHGFPGIHMNGLHCYDGHRTETDFEERKEKTASGQQLVEKLCSTLTKEGFDCTTLVMGGSSTMPCYLSLADQIADTYFSPGTFFVNDYGYTKKFPDLIFQPGAAILTRVISHPKPGHFTLDLGYKGIAADPEKARGIITGMKHVKELFQSEEHWAFAMEPGHESECPKIGDELYVIPTHICPTSALYPEVVVVENGQICDTWPVLARNRKITY